MKFSTFTLALLSASISAVAALPTELTNFLLVTTNQAEATSNTSNLKAVSATSLFDPYNQPALLLRLIGPGYGSLPNFTLSSGTLHTVAPGPHGIGTYEYNSTTVTAGQELQFLASTQTAGNLALSDGYLLTVDGEKEGWMICEGQLSSETLWWKSTNATGCEKTFLHAVKSAPY
ncbi:hypothetical protein K491DRAFT_597974 [Lophiostoma macrostomum CBS 122681]|uniref:Pullulan synthetase n=1 Tax=Lophiostoma macrostomum CBS 122681 TaxID=1314788 RepID=A0A6A6T8B2_9PLEO|nr:hypothetical protein K491DRAFT_597974 [Lophiostoma macrostomum CBS 122681]